MSNSHFAYSKIYSILYERWKNERSSDLIQPLEFNFFTQIWNELNSSTLNDLSEAIIEESIIKRVNFFLKNLKTIRWNKINKYLVRELHLDVSLLASHEIETLKNLKSLYEWYKSLPNHSDKEFPIVPIHKLPEGDKGEIVNEIYSESEIFEKKDENIKVKFLVEINEFLGPNLKTYGPFKKNQISILPGIVVSTVLLPRKIIELV
ncbi:MAG: DNA replication complex subunit Gins51 [Candidatus Hodarchaeales archaeon]